MAGALVKRGSRVSPPHPGEGVNTGTDGRLDVRRLRYRLRTAAARVLSQEAVNRCGRYVVEAPDAPHPFEVAVKVGERGAHYSGLITCGSVWHCPVCAARVAEGRRQEVEKVLTKHAEAGGIAYMAAFTIPHHVFQSCKDLRLAVATAWQRVQSGAPWKKKKGRYRLVGTIRVLEVTRGENGWHPHLHVIFLFEGPALFAPFGDWLFDRWAAVVNRLGYGQCNKAVWRFERARSTSQAGDYVVKWGADRELTSMHVKRGKGGGRSPWQILADIADRSDPADIRLFQEYAAAFKGARQLTWSKGLREAFLDIDEAVDKGLADQEPPADTVCFVGKYVFEDLQSRGLDVALLEAAESGGWPAVCLFVQHHGLDHIGIRQAKSPVVMHDEFEIPW